MSIITTFQSLLSKQMTKYISEVSAKYEINEEELNSIWSEVSGMKKKQKRTTKSGYNVFCSEERVKIASDMKPQEVMKELGKRWMALGEEKAEWNEKAKVPVEDGDWPNMGVARLRAECKKKDLSASGTKAKLIERLTNPGKVEEKKITVKALKEELKALGEKIGGNKNELIERLDTVKAKKNGTKKMSNAIVEESESEESEDEEEIDYTKMKVPELRKLCEDRKLEKKGKKAELIARLIEDDDDDDEDEDDVDSESDSDE